MRVSYKKRFLKQLAKLPTRERQSIESFVFEALPQSPSIESVGKFEKMQGYEGYYKARFGSYRVGVKSLSSGEIEVLVVLHRRDVYRQFP